MSALRGYFLRSRWRRRQRLAAPGRFYGADGTIHKNSDLDVETNAAGVVVAVWFRCQPLPFKATQVRTDRALEMQRMYREGPMPAIIGLDLVDS